MLQVNMALPLSLLELSASQVDIYIQLIHRGEAARREQCTLRLSNLGRARVHWKLKSNCSALYSVPVNNEWLDPGCNVDVIIHCRRLLNLTRATLMEDHVFKLVATCGARTQEWRLPVVTHLPQALLPVVASPAGVQQSAVNNADLTVDAIRAAQLLQASNASKEPAPSRPCANTKRLAKMRGAAKRRPAPKWSLPSYAQIKIA